MLNYHDYEKTIFDWLMTKHTANPNFTFTVRQTAGKGSKTDYFIGTSKSNYFSTSFLILPVYFPGSSGDCISLILQLSNNGFSYYFEFNQTQDPKDGQNQSALKIIKALKNPLQKEFSFKRPVLHKPIYLPPLPQFLLICKCFKNSGLKNICNW